MHAASRPGVAVGLLALIATSGCALRRPTVSHWNEAAAGLGGMGSGLTGSEYSDTPRFGAGGALLWRVSYAHCLDKGTSHVCVEIPIDGMPSSAIVSPNLSAPRSYSTLLLTPGVRFGSDELPLGFLPINFFSIGLGAARYVSSTQLLDGRTASSERATTFAVRVEGGLNVKLNQRLGLRAGVYLGDGDLEAWLQQLAVVPESESPGQRVGGYGLLYLRW